MSDSKTLTITEVNEKNGWYGAKATDGNIYSTKNAGIRAFIGKTASFITGAKARKDGHGMNYYVNDPLPEVPSDAPNNNGGNQSQDEKNKYFILSYAKDLTVALINSAQLKDASPSNVVVVTMAIYSGIQESLQAQVDADSIPF